MTTQGRPLWPQSPSHLGWLLYLKRSLAKLALCLCIHLQVHTKASPGHLSSVDSCTSASPKAQFPSFLEPESCVLCSLQVSVSQSNDHAIFLSVVCNSHACLVSSLGLWFSLLKEVAPHQRSASCGHCAIPTLLFPLSPGSNSLLQQEALWEHSAKLRLKFSLTR